MTIASTYAPNCATPAEQAAPADPAKQAELAVQGLLAEARKHPAATHAFLGRFAGAAFADQHRVARRLVVEYSGVAAWGLRYLSALLERVEPAPHRAALLRQLGVAHGQLDAAADARLQRAGIAPATLRGLSHPELFRRLCAALDVEPWEQQGVSPAAQRWRAGLLHFLHNAPVAEAIGALCFGVVGIAAPIGDQLAIGLHNLGSLHRTATVYFELPSLLGDRDLQELLSLATSAARDPHGVAALQRGMHFALGLAAEFWDQLYASSLARRLAHPA